MSIAAMSKAALRRLRGDLGSPTFTWRGASIPCVPNTLGIGAAIGTGGHDVTVTLNLYVDRVEFLSVDSTLITVDSELYTSDNDVPTPMSGKTILYIGATYRIISARFSPCQSFLVLVCGDENM